MRCRNCHTVMMDSDPACPTCHASAASATAAPPEAVSGSRNGLLLLLPMFGGLMGGMLAAALEKPTIGRPGAGAGTGSSKWIFSLFFALVGGIFLLLAIVAFCGTWKIATREPKNVSADELRATDGAKLPAGAWFAYTFIESLPTDLSVKRRRLGRAGDVQARCLLVKANDRWLLASVAPGFEGNRLVGRLVPHDGRPSKTVLDTLRKADAAPAALLPFEFNGVDATASDLQARYVASAWLAGFGVLGLALAFWLIRGKRAAAPIQVDPPRKLGSFLPPPAPARR